MLADETEHNFIKKGKNEEEASVHFITTNNVLHMYVC